MKIIYGIKNCNTVKKVLTYLDEHAIAYTFHDYKKAGITKDRLESWCRQAGWEALVNKKGTTWRQLDDTVKEGVTDAASAIALMAAHTSVIKRPVIEEQDKILSIGWNEEALQQLK